MITQGAPISGTNARQPFSAAQIAAIQESLCEKFDIFSAMFAHEPRQEQRYALIEEAIIDSMSPVEQRYYFSLDVPAHCGTWERREGMTPAMHAQYHQHWW